MAEPLEAPAHAQRSQRIIGRVEAEADRQAGKSSRYRITGPDGANYDVTAPADATPDQVMEFVRGNIGKVQQPQPQQDGTQATFKAPAVPEEPPAQEPGKFSPPKGSLQPEVSAFFDRPHDQVRADIAKMDAADRKPVLDAWAKFTVAREKAKGGTFRAIDDKVRQLVRGTPIGSWVDELTAATSKLPYDEVMAYQKARDEQADADATKLGEIPLPMGLDPIEITTGGVTKLAGAVASAPLAPVARVMQGATMLPRMVNAGITGIGYGAAYGAGEGQDGDRAVNALTGAAVGGGIGVMAPPLASGLGRLVQRSPQPQNALSDMSRKAVERVADDVVADSANPAMLQRMGPEGMIADLGPNLQGHTGAIARMPGEGQTVVRNALRARREGAAGRIAQDIDATLGPPVDLVQAERTAVRTANQNAAPYYREFDRTIIPETPAIRRLLQRVEAAPGVVAQAERLMQLEGFQPRAGMRTGRDWNYFKIAVDDLAQSARDSNRGNEYRLYSQLSSQIRNTIDTWLSRNPQAQMNPAPTAAPNLFPAGSNWQRARELAGEGQQFRAGIEAGQEAFKRGTHPDQMRADLAAMQNRPIERAGFEEGARGAIRDIMGNSATQFGPNGQTAAMRQLGSEFARDKLEQIVGGPGARRIIDRLGNEARFEQTNQTAVGNSVTAAMQAAQKRYSGTNDPSVPMPSSSLWGDVKDAARWALNKATAGYMDERARSEARDAARMLVAQGADRDAMVLELMRYINARNTTRQAKAAAQDLIETLTEGSRAPMISARQSGDGRQQ